MTNYEGLPVRGYKPQSQASVELVNANKQAEEWVLRIIDALHENPMVDRRMLSIGRTQMQIAYMCLNRAIFQPSRIRLDGDSDPGTPTP